MAVEVPDCPLAVKPLPDAVPCAHEYAMAILIPTSAVCGWHESCAPRLLHCQPTMHCPFICGDQLPPVQEDAAGCGGWSEHCCCVEGLQGCGVTGAAGSEPP